MLWLDHDRKQLRAAAPVLASCAVHVVLAVPLALCVTAPVNDRTPLELEIVSVKAEPTSDPAAQRPAPPPPRPAPPTPLPTPLPAPAVRARAIRPPATGTMAIASPKRRTSEPDGSAEGPLVVGDEAEEQPTSLSTIRISRAWYGWNSPGCEPVDRTSYVAEACDERAHCQFRVSNRALGGDPCPDLPKGLQVLWECLDAFGAPHEQVTKRAEPALDEGERITFHCP